MLLLDLWAGRLAADFHVGNNTVLWYASATCRGRVRGVGDNWFLLKLIQIETTKYVTISVVFPYFLLRSSIFLGFSYSF
jgi:hypothetical protein